MTVETLASKNAQQTETIKKLEEELQAVEEKKARAVVDKWKHRASASEVSPGPVVAYWRVRILSEATGGDFLCTAGYRRGE